MAYSRSCRVISLFTVIFLTSCATAKFNPSKPIARKAMGFGAFYEQDGGTLDQLDLATSLSARPDTRDEMRGQTFLTIAGMVTSGVGGYMIGYNLVSLDTSSNRSSAPLWIGVGLVGAGLGLGLLAQGKLDRSVEKHNASFKPVAAIAPDFSGGMVGLGGVQIRY